MPQFQYSCDACTAVTEFLKLRSTEVEPAVCDCGGKLQRKLAVSSFALKGGCWASDGYGTSSEKK